MYLEELLKILKVSNPNWINIIMQNFLYIFSRIQIIHNSKYNSELITNRYIINIYYSCIIHTVK